MLHASDPIAAITDLCIWKAKLFATLSNRGTFCPCAQAHDGTLFDAFNVQHKWPKNGLYYVVVQGEEMCSISDPQTSQKLIVLCYTFIFSFHVRCLLELNTKHMKKGNALQNLLGIHFKILPNVYLQEKTRRFLKGLLKPG